MPHLRAVAHNKCYTNRLPVVLPFTLPFPDEPELACSLPPLWTWFSQFCLVLLFSNRTSGDKKHRSLAVWMLFWHRCADHPTMLKHSRELKALRPTTKSHPVTSFFLDPLPDSWQKGRVSLDDGCLMPDSHVPTWCSSSTALTRDSGETIFKLDWGWVKVLHPTQHKIGHFRDVLSSFQRSSFQPPANLLASPKKIKIKNQEK